MFGFSRRRMKIGRLKVQLSDTASGTRSPIRHVKRLSKPSNVEDVSLAQTTSNSDEKNCRNSPAEAELENCTSGNSESWIGLSTSGDSPTPRFNHAATVIGNNKMVVVGGENGQGLLDDVQVLNFENFTWTKASSKLYLSPSSLPLKIPACKGHSLVPWGKKMLLIGGKTNPGSDRISVWAFDTETECWSLIEAKGETPVARCGHTVIRAITVLILFGGEDAKGRKLNDLHMFDLKSFMWLPLHCTGTAPSPRSNHVAALYDDRTLYVFGGASKSRTLNDLYSLDFETMIWSRIKIRGFHPSPRAGCCGVLCGYKWYIAGGGSRKKRHAETLVFDVLKLEWAVAVASPPSSITTNKGFSLVLVQHNDKTCLVAFGGYKKEPSNQAEVLVMDRSEQSVGQRSTLDKGLRPLLFESHSSTLGFAAQSANEARKCPIDSVARQNLASVLEDRGSSRRSVSDSSLVDPNPSPGNGSLRKQFHKEEEYSPTVKVLKNHEGEKCKELSDYSILKDSSVQELKIKQAIEDQTDVTGNTANDEGIASICYNDETVLTETDGKSVGLQQSYEAKLASVVRKNSIIEGQLTAALASREAAEKNLSSVMKSRQEMEKKLSETVKEMELLKEKLSNVEIAQEEANTLSNVVHSDNVRLEHDVAFLKAILEDTQKELHSTRGVLAGERARAFQLQVEVFHLKQRLQSLENRSTTPRKPFHM